MPSRSARRGPQAEAGVSHLRQKEAAEREMTRARGELEAAMAARQAAELTAQREVDLRGNPRTVRPPPAAGTDLWNGVGGCYVRTVEHSLPSCACAQLTAGWLPISATPAALGRSGRVTCLQMHVKRWCEEG